MKQSGKYALALLVALAVVGCAPHAATPPPLRIAAAPVASATVVHKVCRRTTVDGPFVMRARIRAHYARHLTCTRIATVVNTYLSDPASAGGGPVRVGVWRCVFNPPGVCTSRQGRITFVHA